jgi:hypothetical protein
MGTAAEKSSTESPSDSALAQESTSPLIVGPGHGGLWLFRCDADRGSDGLKTRVSGSRNTVDKR